MMTATVMADAAISGKRRLAERLRWSAALGLLSRQR